MPKTEVKFDAYLGETVAALPDGLLLVSLDPEGQANAMAIGWATVGIVWGRPMFVVLVRYSRYTFECMDATGDFTINVPYPRQAEAVQFCGTVSGRDHDKFAECGFTVVESEMVKSPHIGECGLVYECRVVQHTDVIPENFDPAIISQFYVDGDFHRIYFGEILRVVADEDFGDRGEGLL